MRRQGLGRLPQLTGIMGISMGGYGALLLAEKHPHLFAAVAAISPAVWTSYQQAKDANAGAYASAAAFAGGNVITHAAALAACQCGSQREMTTPSTPVSRPSHAALPAGADVSFGKGCHTGSFFVEQEPPSLAFLARHLVT